MNITKEKLIYNIHYSYLKAGADIIETNTFNSTMTSQKIIIVTAILLNLIMLGAELARNSVEDYKKKIQI